MAWTAPRTWTTGELVTAALMNAHLRDNLLETSAAAATTAGDLTYADGANSMARLAKGTAYQALRMNLGVTAPEWGSAPAVRAYNNANLAINSATDTRLTFNSERYDIGTCHDTGSNTGRLTAPIAGIYHIFGNVDWGANVATFELWVLLNNTTIIGKHAYKSTTIASKNIQQVSTSYQLAATDYVELWVRHDEGSGLNVVVSANFSPEFGMHWTGPTA